MVGHQIGSEMDLNQSKILFSIIKGFGIDGVNKSFEVSNQPLCYSVWHRKGFNTTFFGFIQKTDQKKQKIIISLKFSLVNDKVSIKRMLFAKAPIASERPSHLLCDPPSQG